MIGSPHNRNIQSSCWVAMWDSQQKTHGPSMSHSFSLHTHSDAAICFRHPKDNSDVIATTAQRCARQPGHSIPSRRHFHKPALLVLAIRHWVSYCIWASASHCNRCSSWGALGPSTAHGTGVCSPATSACPLHCTPGQEHSVNQIMSARSTHPSFI